MMRLDSNRYTRISFVGIRALLPMIFCVGGEVCFAQFPGQKTYCNPVDLNYQYNFEQKARGISYRSAADPVIVNHMGEYFLFATISAARGALWGGLLCATGASPNGEWKLFVRDDTFPDAGSIEGGWFLNLIIPPPSPSIFAITYDQSTGMVTITFTGQLQASDSLTTPSWQNVPGSGSVNFQPSGQQKFYRSANF